MAQYVEDIDVKAPRSNHSGSLDNVQVNEFHSDPASVALARPPIDHSSFAAFFYSSWVRFKSIWTQRFVFSLIAGQVVSFCITCTNVTTTELVQRNWSLPTTQTWFLCVVVCRDYAWC
jgi:hypothetical protein